MVKKIIGVFLVLFILVAITGKAVMAQVGNGDACGNGGVTVDDVKCVLTNWLSSLTNSVDQYMDGKINSMDFAVVAKNLGIIINPTITSGPSPTPPPGGLIVNECDTSLGLVKVETQAWWVDEANDGNPFDDYGHLHATLCFPMNRPVPPSQIANGMWRTNVRIVMKHNPTSMFILRFDGQSAGRVAEYHLNPNLTCPVHMTCAWNMPVELPLDKFTNTQLRVRFTGTTLDGKVFTTSSDWMVQGGNTGAPVQGKGWYADPVNDYAIAQIPNINQIPHNPVSGTFSIGYSTKSATKRLEVTMDRSHGIPAVGPWLEEPPSTGPLLANTGGGSTTVSIDTRQFKNGWHTFAARSTNPNGFASQCNICDNDPDFLSGIMKFWFYIQN